MYFVALGLTGGTLYDLLQAFRREIRHGAAALVAEDSLFALAVCTGCYGLFFWKNQGALRAYGFVGLLAGATLYQLTVSPWVRRCFIFFFRVLLYPLRRIRAKWKRKSKFEQKTVDESQRIG